MFVFIAIGTQDEIDSAILLSVACSVLLYFSHYLINVTMLGKRYLTKNLCFHFLYKCFLKHILKGTEADVIKMNVGLHEK